ncbi:hypothetical protein B296_00014560 [Ensete ventricosum]|uniref:RRM domain-containing protein n=1 Tax=Ensete ventricosum TaxID=4639 RepID=A0A427AG43_ENSVE|nr:hypothetical protein B296_00014560 [Ensete ventricosum]
MQHLVLQHCMTTLVLLMEVCVTFQDKQYSQRGYFGPSRGMGRKIFVGRLPQDASAEDLREYFSRFGHILDVYVPKVAIDSAAPLDDAGPSGGFMDAAEAYRGYGPMRNYGRLYGSLNFDDRHVLLLRFLLQYGYGAGGSSRTPRMNLRYRPY